jgi:hypothetical protein
MSLHNNSGPDFVIGFKAQQAGSLEREAPLSLESQAAAAKKD